MAGAWIPLPGYPTAVGNKLLWRGDHPGPAAYATGGEIPVPNAFGFQGIEDLGFGFGGYSYSNNYYVKAWPPTGNVANVNEQFAPTFTQTASNANNTNMPQLAWYYAANNNQVAANTNLAAELVRITAWGV